MEPKKIALLVGAVVVALVTALMARSMIMKSSTPIASAMPAQPLGPKVLVATRALPVGTILDDASFRYQPWPKELIEGAYYVEGTPNNPNSLRGAVVRTAISAGQPMTMGSVVQPGDRGFLAAALAPGMRAITVSVSVATGVAGFVFPGDRVDLMLTQSVDGQGQAPLKVSETIVRNLRVLATDQRTVPEDEKGNKEVRQFATVTIEVTPKIGEKIAVAQTIGQLILSLRPIADDTTELERAIASGTVRLPNGSDPKAEKQMLMRIASQPSDSDTTFVTGGDVSRYQRRSVPRPVAAGAGAAPIAGPVSSAVGSVGSMLPPVAPRGPVVIIARGNNITEVTVTRGK